MIGATRWPAMIVMPVDQTIDLSPRAASLLRVARQHRVVIVLTTRGDLPAARPMTPLADFIIRRCGAVIDDVAEGTVAWQAGFDLATALRLRELVRAEDSLPVAAALTVTEVPADPRWSALGRLSSSDGSPCLVALRVADPSLAAGDLVARLAGVLPPSVAVHPAGRRRLDLQPVGVDKGAAVAGLASALGIASRDVIAFGRDASDWTMLHWAGRSYALADADDPTRSLVDGTATSPGGDGIADLIGGLVGSSGSTR